MNIFLLLRIWIYLFRYEISLNGYLFSIFFIFAKLKQIEENFFLNLLKNIEKKKENSLKIFFAIFFFFFFSKPVLSIAHKPFQHGGSLEWVVGKSRKSFPPSLKKFKDFFLRQNYPKNLKKFFSQEVGKIFWKSENLEIVFARQRENKKIFHQQHLF